MSAEPVKPEQTGLRPGEQPAAPPAILSAPKPRAQHKAIPIQSDPGPTRPKLRQEELIKSLLWSLQPSPPEQTSRSGRGSAKSRHIRNIPRYPEQRTQVQVQPGLSGADPSLAKAIDSSLIGSAKPVQVKKYQNVRNFYEETPATNQPSPSGPILAKVSHQVVQALDQPNLFKVLEMPNQVQDEIQVLDQTGPSGAIPGLAKTKAQRVLDLDLDLDLYLDLGLQKQNQEYPEVDETPRSGNSSPAPAIATFCSSDLALASMPGSNFDPRKRHLMPEELKPQPIVRKRSKVNIIGLHHLIGSCTCSRYPIDYCVLISEKHFILAQTASQL